MHSGGGINVATDNEVLSSLAPEWSDFAEKCCNKGFTIVCVTFTDSQSFSRLSDSQRAGVLSGAELVQAVMRQCKAKFTLSRIYPFYPRNYTAPNEYRDLGLDKPMTHSKSYHLASVCRDYNVVPSEVVLIDDDVMNCSVAAAEGYGSLFVSRRRGFDIATLETV
eukprot:Lankesteria_metandrocarpae@DN5352_c2_g1_i3.p1